MKVGILFDGPEIPPKCGVAYRFYYLSRFLAKKGVEVVGFFSDRGTASYDNIKNEPFKSHFFSPRVFYKDPKTVLDIIRKEKVDILQVNNSQSVLLFGAKYSHELKVPLVTEMHDVDSTLKRTLKADINTIEEMEFVQYCASLLSHNIICMTDIDHHQLIQIGVEARKLNIIPNGIDTEYYKFSIPKFNQKQIVFLGNMFYLPNKNAAEKIITQIMPRLPEMKLVCIGMADSSFANKYSSSQVTFSGPVDDIRPILESSSIAVAPIFEGSGMKVKILNFAAAGLPILTTSFGIPGYPSEIATVENDLCRYPQIIKSILSNKDHATNQVKKSRKIIEKHYSWETIANDVVNLYHKTKFSNLTTIRENVNKWPPPRDLIYKKHAPLPIWLEESRIKYGKETFKHLEI